MKIATWNIAGGFVLTSGVENASGYTKEDLTYFINTLKDDGSDVICLQETHTSLDSSDIQGKEIAKKLDFNFVNHAYTNAQSHIKSGQYLSLTTLSRFPITSSYFSALPDPKISVTRPNGDVWVSLDVGFLVTEIDYNGVAVKVANTYLVPFHYFGKDALDFKDVNEATTELLLSLSEKPTIAVGDFNYPDLKILLPKVFKAGFEESFFEDSTPKKGQQDHILFTRDWRLNNFEIQKTNSDHYLCTTMLELK